MLAALAIAGAAVLGACSEEVVVPSAVPAAAVLPTPLPTATPSPTPVPEPTPTPGPTATPTVEPTVTPTAEPPDVLFRYTYAVRLLNAAQYEDAIPQFEFVLRILPDFHLAYNGRGLAHLQKEKPNLELASEDFTKVIEIEPDFAEGYMNRGAVRIRQGDRDGAIDDLQKAMTLFTQDGELGSAGLVQTLLDGVRNPSP